MMFASKTPHDLNSDPEPYASSAPDFERYEHAEDNPRTHPVTFDPRPEYDHPQHNEPNPILLWHREATRSGWSPVAARYILTHWKSTVGILPALGIATFTPDHADHARRVLTRLARFTEQETPA
jgi:hypothetical protein